MGVLTTAGKNRMLDGSWSPPNKASLHTAEPNAEGSNEVSGGGYARQTLEWNAAAAGTMDDKGGPRVFSIPAGTTVKWVGYWDAGTLVAIDDVPDEAFTGAGTYTLEDADLSL